VALGIRRCLAMFQFSVSEFDQQQSEERGRGGGGGRQAAGTEERKRYLGGAGGRQLELDRYRRSFRIVRFGVRLQIRILRATREGDHSTAIEYALGRAPNAPDPSHGKAAAWCHLW
jgi:hypothetical protein